MKKTKEILKIYVEPRLHVCKSIISKAEKKYMLTKNIKTAKRRSKPPRHISRSGDQEMWDKFKFQIFTIWAESLSNKHYKKLQKILKIVRPVCRVLRIFNGLD